MSWVVKRKHYGGGESIVAHKATEAEAQNRADLYNEAYQTDNYVIEPYDSVKAAQGWGDIGPAVDVKGAIKGIIDAIKSKSKKSLN